MHRRPARAFTLPALAVALVLTPTVRAGDDPVVTSDLLRLRTVASVDVAAGGARAVLVVRGVEAGPAPSVDPGAPAPEPAWSNVAHLWTLDLHDRGAAPRQLTFGLRRDADAVISPDGRRIAFTRRGPGDDAGAPPQVWVLDLGGGEARPVTALAHGARAPQWSPDGRRLLVHGDVPIDEIPGTPPWTSARPGREWTARSAPGAAPPRGRPDGTRAEVRAWLDGNARDGDPVVVDRLDFQDEHGLRGPMTVTHVFLVDPDDAGAPPRRLTEGFHDHDDARFVGDGGAIVCATAAPATAHPDEILTRTLRLVPLDGAAPRTLLALDGWRLDRPRPSRDGSMLAFRGRPIERASNRPTQLGVISLTAGAPEPVWLTDEQSLDRSVHAFAWQDAKASLLFTAASAGGFPLLTASPGLLQPAPLVDRDAAGGPVGVHAFDAGGGAVVYALTTPSRPCVLRVRDGFGDREAWDLNPWVDEKRLALPREFWIDRPDGTRVQAWLMAPPRREDGRRAPLVLEIHGGPHVMWGPGELTMWHEFQVLCAWGYGVVYANPRGSGGYGRAFREANDEDWGAGPAGDVLAAVDRALQEEWVDPDRLVVTGGSYGGYLTTWILGNDRRFKAAVAQRGVYDLETFFGEGNAWRLVEFEFGGRPWEARVQPILHRESPLTYVNRIRTPLLIIHASGDHRTGVAQSEMLYRSLRALGRPVEYVRYPGAGHDLSRTGDPRQRMDRLDRIVEFLERFVENPAPAPVVPASGG